MNRSGKMNSSKSLDGYIMLCRELEAIDWGGNCWPGIDQPTTSTAHSKLAPVSKPSMYLGIDFDAFPTYDR